MLTVCITSFNTLLFLKLAVLSLRKHCPVPFKLWIWDNSSSDGSAEWAAEHADICFRGINSVHGHGGALDRMGEIVATEFVAFVDSDMEFIGDAFSEPIRRMRVDNGIFACDGGYFKIGGLPFTLPDGRSVTQMERIDPCCAILPTMRLIRLMKSGVSWKVDIRNDRIYDVGGRMYEAAISGGMKVTRCDEVRRNARHFGNSTWPKNGCGDPEVIDRVSRNMLAASESLRGYEC